MRKSSHSTIDEKKKLDALRIIANTTKGSFFAVALGAIAIGSGYILNPALALIPQGIIIGGMSVLIDRILRGENIDEEEIHSAVVDSGIEKILGDNRQNQQYADELITEMNFISHLVKNNDIQLLYDYLAQQKPFPESRNFSPEIKNQLKLANKTIDALTEEQYRILTLFQNWSQVAVSGCAGSGKTLLAAEKVRRVAKDGKSILFLCHNPYLAEYVQTLVTGTGAIVQDFKSWIYFLRGEHNNSLKNWSHYVEPTDQELFEALASLIDNNYRYDAIFVDEAQDFREEWWDIINEALLDKAKSILWIFHDDNQSLLHRQLKYPVLESPITLTTNCRNSGNIFDVVRVFHSQSPRSENLLLGQGVLRQNNFSKREEMMQQLSNAINQLHKEEIDDFVVLTTEPEPVDQSVLNRVEIDILPKWRWQDVIFTWLGQTNLSDDPYPNENDIHTVVEKARTTIPHGWKTSSQIHKMKWRVTDDEIYLSHPYGSYPEKGRHFFMEENWAEGIPLPRKVQIIADYNNATDTYQLKTVSSFKGLENDNIILVIPSVFSGDRSMLESTMYVGLSRARFLLHIIIDNQIINKLPQLKTFGRQ
jgi:hypothetical protein